MRVTRAELQEMIDQEVAAALLLSENRKLIESGNSDSYDCSIHELLEFARAYSSLTQQQRETLHAAADGRSCLVEHVSVIVKKFRGMNRELDQAMAAQRA